MTDKTSTVSKTQELVEAARKRKEIEQANSTQPAKTPEQRFSDAELDQLKEDAEIKAEGKVQAKAGTITGKVDVEAMGDVKGDGGDAKDYDDNDPDKALGVPTYIHGLAETKGGVDTITAVDAENHVTARTRAEQARGREVIEGREADRAAAQSNRRVTARSGETVVEDADEEKLAAEAKAKRAAEEKAKASK